MSQAVASLAEVAQRRIAHRYPLMFGLFSLSAIMPTGLALIVQALVFLNAFVEWFTCSRDQRRGGYLVLLVLIIVWYWGILLTHPNVPNLQTGLLGLRKTTFALGGLVFGLAVRQWHLQSADRMTAKVLAFAVALSIVAHIWIPSLTALAASEDADLYTSLIGGQQRMQGIFSGPFHAAIASCLLVAWSLINLRTWNLLAKVFLIVGLIGIHFTLVRTIYIALAGVVLVFIMLAPSSRVLARRLTLLSVAVFVGIGISSSGVGFDANGGVLAILSSIAQIGQDQRFLHRLSDYEYALRLIEASPMFGWGSGSAGDTLGAAFGSGVHVTSHNIALKMLVEGGIIGIILWALLLFMVLRNIDYKTNYGRLALASVVILACMGLTGSAIEALPPTFFLFLFVGLGIKRAPHSPPPGKLRRNQSFRLTST